VWERAPTNRETTLSIIVGFIRSPEGEAALDRAIEEARLRDQQLLVVHSMKGGTRDEQKQVDEYGEAFAALEARLPGEGIRFRLVDYVRGNEPVEDLLQAAAENDGDLIVIGLRRRSAVGKLVLGSNAQEILLRADTPVLAVKAARRD
jgi:nucleotide-binding universal stress UspA family protein